jgi:hypothetical protein
MDLIYTFKLVAATFDSMMRNEVKRNQARGQCRYMD